MATTAKESSLQIKILKDLRSFGKYIVVFKVQKTSDNGVPDVFFTSKHTGPVFVELKQKGKKPGPLQRFVIYKLNKCGMKAFVCDTWDNWVLLKHKLGLSLKNLQASH